MKIISSNTNGMKEHCLKNVVYVWIYADTYAYLQFYDNTVHVLFTAKILSLF